MRGWGTRAIAATVGGRGGGGGGGGEAVSSPAPPQKLGISFNLKGIFFWRGKELDTEIFKM